MTTSTRKKLDDDVRSILATELNTYAGNKARLLKTAAGKYVLVHHTQVCGPYETEMDAVADGYRNFGHVPFLVKKVEVVERAKRSRLPTQSRRMNPEGATPHVVV